MVGEERIKSQQNEILSEQIRDQTKLSCQRCEQAIITLKSSSVSLKTILCSCLINYELNDNWWIFMTANTTQSRNYVSQSETRIFVQRSAKLRRRLYCTDGSDEVLVYWWTEQWEVSDRVTWSFLLQHLWIHDHSYRVLDMGHTNIVRISCYPCIAVETLGVLNSSANSLLKESGNKISLNTAQSREVSFLHQRISVLVQRFSAILLHDSLRTNGCADWISYLQYCLAIHRIMFRL